MSKQSEYMARYRATHPEYAEYMRQWRANNRERVKASRRAYYEEHKEQELASVKTWQSENPDTVKLIAKVNSANSRYPGKITIEDLRGIIDRCGNKCYWCGEEDLQDRNFTLEHLKPVNDPQYLVIACHACNASKCVHVGHRLTPEEKKQRKRDWQDRYDAENSDHLITKKKEWAERNKEKLREYHREYYLRKKREKEQSTMTTEE